jgi:hypothetical protein
MEIRDILEKITSQLECLKCDLKNIGVGDVLQEIDKILSLITGPAGSPQDKIQVIKSSLEDMIAVLQSKGLSVPNDTAIFQIASFIDMLDALVVVPEPEWQPHPDWWDIKQIFEDCPEPDKRAIYLFDDSAISILVARTAFNNTAGSNVKVITSDGVEYLNAGNGIYHTWNGTGDKVCSDGYKTRYVIVCCSLTSMWTGLQGRADTLWAYFGNNVEVVTGTSGSIGFYSNMCIEAIEYDNTVTFPPSTVANVNSMNILQECRRLVKFKIPENFEIFHNNFAHNAYMLSKIDIPNATSLNASSFQQMRNLKQITLPNTLTYIGNSCFRYCYSLESINIPNSVTVMDSNGVNIGYQFADCINVKNITIGTGLSVLPFACFYLNYKLRKVFIPSNIVEIQNSAFSGCTSMREVTFSEGLVTLGNTVFDSNTLLTEALLPNSLVSIGTQCFRWCNSLTTIRFGSGLTSVQNNSFEVCNNVRDIQIQPGWICPPINLNFTNVWTISSIERFINNLGTAPTMRNINVNATNLAKISSTLLALATSKNYNFVV